MSNGELGGFGGREIRCQHTFLSTSSSKDFACSTRGHDNLGRGRRRKGIRGVRECRRGSEGVCVTLHCWPWICCVVFGFYFVCLRDREWRSVGLFGSQNYGFIRKPWDSKSVWNSLKLAALCFLFSLLLGVVIMMPPLAYCMKTLNKFDKTVFYILLVPSLFFFFISFHFNTIKQ